MGSNYRFRKGDWNIFSRFRKALDAIRTGLLYNNFRLESW